MPPLVNGAFTLRIDLPNRSTMLTAIVSVSRPLSVAVMVNEAGAPFHVPVPWMVTTRG